MTTEEKQALAFYNNITNHMKVIDLEVAMSVLITLLGKMPRRIAKENCENLIILTATAVIAEGLNDEGPFRIKRCMDTADKLQPFIKEAVKKYKQL